MAAKIKVEGQSLLYFLPNHYDIVLQTLQNAMKGI